jgi:hypothetical protein
MVVGRSCPLAKEYGKHNQRQPSRGKGDRPDPTSLTALASCKGVLDERGVRIDTDDEDD